MKLADLLAFDAVSDARIAAVDIRGVTADSRTVKPGDLFIALTGAKDDGLRFVAQALAAGAAAVVAERTPAAPLPPGIPVIKVADARRALALAAAKFFPRQPATVAAVTGTSGKTSVAAFTRQIWTALGRQAASIGTVGLVAPTRETYGSLTTPDPVALHRSLDALAAEGVTHLAIEASSHGLDQRRLDGVRIAAGAFTNLSRDHLDYHPTLDAYLAAKLRLFSDLLDPGAAAVIFRNSDHADVVEAVAQRRGLRLLTIGRCSTAMRLLDSAIDGFAQTLKVAFDDNEHGIRLPLVGAFQVENALVAAGLAIATGSEPAAVFATLENLQGAKGRLRARRRTRRRPDLR